MMRSQAVRYATLLIVAAAYLLCGSAPSSAQKFFDDDPRLADPPPRPTAQALSRKFSDYFDFIQNTLATPGELNTASRRTPAREVNTLGDVPDSAWYTQRHYYHPMTSAELAQGPGKGSPPVAAGPWTVVSAKSEGITPGFTIVDSRGQRYVLKFDPLNNPEIATAADVISSKFLHALGYNVPENYIVEFSREQLRLGDKVLLRDVLGNERAMSERDITEIMLNVPRTREGRYRGVASLFIAGRNLGPFRYFGARRDDPNDITPHEHRRDLRGLSVFAAWLGHDDSRSINTADFLVNEGGIQFIKHYLIDFGSTLGSASNGPNSSRSGFEYLFSWKPSIVQMLTAGLLIPPHARAQFPPLPSVGRFEWERFDPLRWVPEYPNAAFLNRLPDDGFWAAKQVMSFSDEAIREIVRTGRYSDPRAEAWIVECLIRRRDKIGRAYFSAVLPLDRFALREGQLVFEDLAAKHGFPAHSSYAIQWSRFDNATGTPTLLAGADEFAAPPAALGAAPGEYFSAELSATGASPKVTVYMRMKNSQLEVVGVDRTW